MNGRVQKCLAAAVLASLGLTNYAVAEPPDFFIDKHINSAAFAHAVNHFVSIDQRRAARELKAIARINQANESTTPVDERIALLCRVLFDPEHNRLRRHRFGGIAVIARHTSDSEWPMSPLVKTGETFFILPTGFSVQGLSESVDDYIDYCLIHGRFRTKLMPVPTPESAQKDLDSLLSSERWLKISWKTDAGFVSQEWVESSLASQVPFGGHSGND